MRTKKFSETSLKDCGLINIQGQEFFSARVVIPILDGSGAVIGFSARKITDHLFGPKYLNTPETPIFKKSKILFGLHDSRKRIIKEKRVLIVEGQIDALRLIHCGFDWTVASQGTAFGEEMTQELIQLGVRQVYLGLDGDIAGKTAAAKIGHLFKKKELRFG